MFRVGLAGSHTSLCDGSVAVLAVLARPPQRAWGDTLFRAPIAAHPVIALASGFDLGVGFGHDGSAMREDLISSQLLGARFVTQVAKFSQSC